MARLTREDKSQVKMFPDKARLTVPIEGSYIDFVQSEIHSRNRKLKCLQNVEKASVWQW